MFSKTRLLTSSVLHHTLLKTKVQNRVFSTTLVICDKKQWETQSGHHTIAEKWENAQKIFDILAKKYDLVNDVAFFGLLRVWKSRFLERLGDVKDKQIIDVAGGTGDIPIMILNKIRDNTGTTHITACDMNETMLNVGRMRSNRQGFGSDLVTWKIDNGESLSFPDNTFDMYTISLGIRNVAHIDKILQEAHRVLKPGGKFYCLELYGQLENRTAQWIFDQYTTKVLPVFWYVFTRQLQSYRYLVESIRNTPSQVFACVICKKVVRFSLALVDLMDLDVPATSQLILKLLKIASEKSPKRRNPSNSPTRDTVTRMVKDAGFKKVTCEHLTFGTASIHSGIKQ